MILCFLLELVWQALTSRPSLAGLQDFVAIVINALGGCLTFVFSGTKITDWISVGITAIAAVVALNAYRYTRRAAREAHAQTLFREYLKFRADIQANSKSVPDKGDFISYKLHALEELWDYVEQMTIFWSDNESGGRKQDPRRFNIWPMSRIPPLGRSRRKEWQAYFKSWEQTIAYQLHRDGIETIEHMMLPHISEIYGRRFVKFVKRTHESLTSTSYTI
ncbi:hypothetical protein DAH66_11460 [Sphingomonas koreensis]|uniref:Uncharacterized protein n=1 Tax=Sphingomonas koreensis TaxID=93064 RepID=A0A430G3C5_9SPHN|nr:hypothetical protein [Sphingomonas koreensis]RSY84686.1 hypothetical protein DAH66_11460 [Sphingomonas koreensis]